MHENWVHSTQLFPPQAIFPSFGNYLATQNHTSWSKQPKYLIEVHKHVLHGFCVLYLTEHPGSHTTALRFPPLWAIFPSLGDYLTNPRANGWSWRPQYLTQAQEHVLNGFCVLGLVENA